MTVDSRPAPRHISGSLHVTLWWVTLLLAVVVLTFAIAVLDGLLRSGRIAVDVAALLVLSVAALAGVLAYWRRYWFRPADLRRLVSAQAGTDFRRRRSLSGIQMKARFGSLWMLATLNRPILDVLPTWPTYELARKLALGLPEFMLQGGRVGLVQLGDFSRFPETDIAVTGRREVTLAQSGDESLDRAVRAAAQTLGSEDIVLRVEVRRRWLQIEVDGGAWSGARFAQRIELALQFGRRLVEQLAGSFTPMDVRAWTVEQEYVRARRGGSTAALERQLQLTAADESNKRDT